MADETQNSLVKKLNQMRCRIERDLEDINELKMTAPPQLFEMLEKIENSGWTTVIELNEAQKKINVILQETIERNTVLHRTANRSGRRDPELNNGGNVRI